MVLLVWWPTLQPWNQRSRFHPALACPQALKAAQPLVAQSPLLLVIRVGKQTCRGGDSSSTLASAWRAYAVCLALAGGSYSGTGSAGR